MLSSNFKNLQFDNQAFLQHDNFLIQRLYHFKAKQKCTFYLMSKSVLSASNTFVHVSFYILTATISSICFKFSFSFDTFSKLFKISAHTQSTLVFHDYKIYIYFYHTGSTFQTLFSTTIYLETSIKFS